MWELDHKEGWALENWSFQIVVLEKTLESPLDSKEIKPVKPKGGQPWKLTGRTDAEADAPIIWLPDVKSQLIGKDPDAGKDWGQEKGVAEDDMVGWHHWLSGHEFEQTPGDGEGQGSLECYSPWGCKESDMTERLNWTALNERNQRWHKQMERYSMFLGRKNQYCKNDHTTKHNLQIQCDPYQITNGIFTELEQKISQFIWNTKDPE